jgi:hypothetical protein
MLAPESDRSEALSFRESTLRFGTVTLGAKITQLRRRLSTQDCLLLASATPTVAEIVDHCFSVPSNMYTLLRIEYFPLWRKERDEALREIEDLQCLIETRLRLHASKVKPSLNNGLKTVPKLFPRIPARTSLSEIHRRRKQQQPFLYAAKCLAPQFLGMTFDDAKPNFMQPEIVYSQIRDKAQDRAAFGRLCSAAKAIAPLIESGWSSEVVAALEPVAAELPSVEPIPTEDLPTKEPRHSATETKKAARGQVGNLRPGSPK